MSEHSVIAGNVENAAKGYVCIATQSVLLEPHLTNASSGVLMKLTIFAISLAAVPLLTYYVSSVYVFGG
jgi:hypothetical protein